MALLLLALATRSIHFAEYPFFGGDELHNSWAGFNLLHEGKPRSWSRHGVYRERKPLRFFSRSFPIVESAFDHPPLVQIVAGTSATLLGARNMFECTPERIRPPMVILGSASVVLLFFLAKRLFGYRTAFLAGLFMAVSPLVVLNSRLVKEEGLVQFLWLAGALLYLKASEKRNTPGLDFLCGAVLGLAALSKIHGIALGAAFAAAAIATPPANWKRALRLLGTSLAVAALYPLYGLIVDAEAYLAVVTWLSSRYPVMGEDLAQKFLILPRFILEPKASAGISLIDGWILLGWLSILFLRRCLPIVIPLSAYLLALMATIHSSNLFGFYVIPVLPFLCMGAGQLMERVLSKPAFFLSFLFLGLVVLPELGRMPLVGGVGYRGLLGIASFPLALGLFRSRPPIARLETGLLEVLLALSVVGAAHQSVSTF
jgi:4-amino-4-deoxy-L-arabinose transferase-like glycosyltransferase